MTMLNNKTTETNTKKVTVYRMSMPEHECPWGLRAIKLLQEQGIEFEDVKLRSREEVDQFKAKHGVATTPQIFFGSDRIGGYTDLAERLKVEAEKAEYSYTPVAAVFSTAGLMALATSLGIPGFMGFSLSLLASLKLMDLNSFAESFEKYDLVTKRFKPYGKIYPFAELLIGLGFLSGIAPLATGISSLVVGVSGAVSVFKAVYIDKLALNCACVGGNSKAPLGVVSFAENTIMAVMGGMLTFSSLSEANIQPMRALEASPPAVVQMQESNPNQAR
ncbi:MAG: glutaredoxin [Leptolyngbya sp. UWPOB_LEPTO1]|uniref:glutaredoxin family protein n=1 Tax=Leptolyngbya sp. UWPOB_LEPTO1 TaxID=2815653 RepID=UPI001ACC8D64|nr:glutaredoxin [Leptolyngbya sp. UWPOB_LEPTO1]MBN8560131.1 glutaredoxin [Leptolyngbya sp. UWPOB_LEPTO1]